MNIETLHTLTLDMLADPAIYENSETLQNLARDAGNRYYESHGRGQMGRGDFKRACAAGQYPDLVLAEVRRHLAEMARIDDLLDDAQETLAVLELPAGWAASMSYPHIILTGPYHAEMPARLRRLGGNWDAPAKQWLIPAEKHASLKRIFANAEKAAAQKSAAANAVRAEKARIKAEAAAARASARADEKTRRQSAIADRVRVPVGKYQVGDTLFGKSITSFGQSWAQAAQRVRVTDETACAYGMQPGLDYYPTVTVPGGEFCYAYFD